MEVSELLVSYIWSPLGTATLLFGFPLMLYRMRRFPYFVVFVLASELLVLPYFFVSICMPVLFMYIWPFVFKLLILDSLGSGLCSFGAVIMRIGSTSDFANRFTLVYWIDD